MYWRDAYLHTLTHITRPLETVKQSEEHKAQQPESENPTKPTDNDKKPPRESKRTDKTKHSKHLRVSKDKEKHKTKIEKKSPLLEVIN